MVPTGPTLGPRDWAQMSLKMSSNGCGPNQKDRIKNENENNHIV